MSLDVDAGAIRVARTERRWASTGGAEAIAATVAPSSARPPRQTLRLRCDLFGVS